ncbi:MAG: AAA family ATPase [Ignavibacteria bacterium]
MNITYKGKYKSIEDFEWYDIPDFCVITGPNGVGKTQILELINNFLTNNQQGFQDLGLGTLNLEGLEISKEQVIFLRSNFRVHDPNETNLVTLQSHNQSFESVFKKFQRNENIGNPLLEKYFLKIINEIGKDKNEISESEFSKHPKDYFIWKENSIFEQEVISKIFYTYFINDMSERANGLSQTDILKKIGPPPWELINDIIRETNLPFKLNNPTEFGMTSNFFLKVTNIDTKEQIKLTELSSGEKILLSLGFWLYVSEEKKVFPKILLLDEPDAHLHPSMAKQFINSVYNVLVKKHGIKIIMSTHSPSTVAFAPDDSIIEMKRFNPRFNRSSSKNKTVSSLTSGIITVHPGTRYVLVEDDDDVLFYSEIIKQLLSEEKINPDISIAFIASSNPKKNEKKTGGGGKNEVTKWVGKLQSSGLESIIQGIIDRDLDNKTSDGVHLLKRYCIENYLIDPLIVYSVLLDNEKAPKIENVNLKFGEEYKLKHLDNLLLQEISNTVINAVEKNLSPKVDETDIVNIEFNYDIELKYPKWILNKNGKELLISFQSLYTPTIINKKNLLKMFRKLLIIPNDFIELFTTIQNN